jgi:tryptophan-rich sensory protein
MALLSIVQSVQDSAVAEWMRTSVKAMPIVESIHVLAAATVFGTIFIVDLRLLGFPNTRRPFTRVSDEMLRLTWTAFCVALITGLLMFAANANTYFENTAFRLKMLALLAAGLNMVIFQRMTFRTVGTWDTDVPAPFAARLAGALSILVWLSVIFFARWIGFTKGFQFDAPENVDFTFP